MHAFDANMCVCVCMRYTYYVGTVGRFAIALGMSMYLLLFCMNYYKFF